MSRVTTDFYYRFIRIDDMYLIAHKNNDRIDR